MALSVIVILLILAAGYVTQRGTTCAVSAATELVVHHRPSRLIGFLFCASVALLMLAIGHLAGLPVLSRYVGHPVMPLAVAGGVVFGIGALINGRCAFGTIARLGAGELPRLGTLGGFLLGAWVILGGEMAPVLPGVSSPLATMAPPALLAGAFFLLAVLGLALLRMTPPVGRPGEWTPLRSMAAVGVINGTLLLLAQRWPYTNLLIDLAGTGPMEAPWRTALALVFIAGAIGGALASDSFVLETGTRHAWLRATGGGVLMGSGATLVPGGNDTMLLIGLPLLLANLVFAYLAMLATLIATIAIRRIRR